MPGFEITIRGSQSKVKTIGSLMDKILEGVLEYGEEFICIVKFEVQEDPQ